MNTPEIENAFVSGKHNVWVAWYVADAQVSALYEMIEGTTMPWVMFAYGALVIYHNYNSDPNFQYTD